MRQDQNTQLAGVAPAALGRKEGLDTPSTESTMLRAVLERVGHGVAVVNAQGRVSWANAMARAELNRSATWHADADGAIRPSQRACAELWRAALSKAQRGLRTMLVWEGAMEEPPVAVLPLSAACPGLPPLSDAIAVLVFGKRRGAVPLEQVLYAAARGLTPAERQVLLLLTAGRSPGEVAEDQGVALSTVRTQIVALRQKLGAPNLRTLIERMHTLPRMVAECESMAVA